MILALFGLFTCLLLGAPWPFYIIGAFCLLFQAQRNDRRVQQALDDAFRGSGW